MLRQDMRQPNYHRLYNRNVMTTAYVEQEFGLKFEPCPFCFSPYPVVTMSGKYPQISCTYCGTDGPISSVPSYDGIPNAVAKWNNRLVPEVPSLKGTQ